MESGRSHGGPRGSEGEGMESLRGSEVDLGHPRGSGKGSWVVSGKGPEGVRGSRGAPRRISGVPGGFLGGVSPLFRVEEGLWGFLLRVGGLGVFWGQVSPRFKVGVLFRSPPIKLDSVCFRTVSFHILRIRLWGDSGGAGTPRTPPKLLRNPPGLPQNTPGAPTPRCPHSQHP